uniref:Selenoprotein V n=1 Tax=Pan troglodytes TaxID=9598 RepID=G2HGN8_PANTR|nr:selenoprotein V [Pan troglodytes]
MDGTVSTMCAKRTVGLCSMTPGCPRSVPCVNAGTASSAAFLRHFTGCDGLVMDEHLMASRTPELPPSACTTFMLAGICLSIQSYY